MTKHHTHLFYYLFRTRDPASLLSNLLGKQSEHLAPSWPSSDTGNPCANMGARIEQFLGWSPQQGLDVREVVQIGQGEAVTG